eukprot:9405206-Alexandrium_andersonii.AAC.1
MRTCRPPLIKLASCTERSTKDPGGDEARKFAAGGSPQGPATSVSSSGGPPSGGEGPAPARPPA